VYAQLGIQLPHYAASQYATTMHINASQLQPEDLAKLVQLSTESSLMGFVGASRPAL
jgi:hypothetical protein